MKKWKNLKGWQKGGIIGFGIMGTVHIFFVTLILFIGGAKGIAGLGFLIIEFPLFILHSHFFESLFENEFYPQFEGIIFWIWIYLAGTITWGIVGAVSGSILGFFVNHNKQG
ncbi:MAG TPA: hypothetical protein VFF54_07250 [Thermodesulfobacteriota bacterium]|nr:hypothetical protein [Thermodesulfobacteriota bacterium]